MKYKSHEQFEISLEIIHLGTNVRHALFLVHMSFLAAFTEEIDEREELKKADDIIHQYREYLESIIHTVVFAESLSTNSKSVELLLHNNRFDAAMKKKVKKLEHLLKRYAAC